MIRCAAAVLETIAEHARREFPRECCGLLIGRDGRIDEARPARNCAEDQSRRYEIDPREHLNEIKRLRGTARAVVGAYHSHPRSSAAPSASDRAEAFGDFIYLIAGPVLEGEPLPVRAYRLEEGNFRHVPLVPDAQEPET